MSCTTGDQSCDTPRRRGAFAMLAIMTLLFIALSIFSFLPSRGQVTPDTVSHDIYMASDGKRVFQAYNCMGCHTLVGNGGYLGPDLTRIHKLAGPAWLAAFLPSAGHWPTAAAVRAQLAQADAATGPAAATDGDALASYLQRFPGAAERIERRGGHASLMPNLTLGKDEVGQLIAYLKYTSSMNTEGWPPKVKVEGFERRLQLAHGTPAVAQATPAATAPAATTSPAEHGAQLVKDYGCVACHANDKTRLVGPGWGGLYNAKVSLADGTTVTADDAYLVASIRHPDAAIVAGYPPSVMPAYDSLLTDGEVNAIVAYLHTLEKQ